MRTIPRNILFYNEKLNKNIITTNADHVSVETLPLFVAPFQRSSDNWTDEMQSKFVENIILGCSTKIILYTLFDSDVHEGCLILDGQHRVLSILNFIENKIKAFGFTCDELMANKIITRNTIDSITIEIVKFNNENEAIEFYINMNENITHTPDDIAKAKTFLKD